MAAEYLSAIGDANKSVTELCAQLRAEYLTIAENLSTASNKQMDSDEKVALLKETKQLEANAIEKVQTLAQALRDPEEP